ncbi:MAG: hypothetical protein PVJ02_10970 [Gemmatimonadota bacterium]
MKPFVAVALTAPLLMLSCSKEPAPESAPESASESAPPPDIAAAAPAGAAVHEFTPADWQGPLCAGSTEWTFDVPSDAWIAMPIGWFAVDEATARANWEHMSYRIWLGDRELDVPEGVQMGVAPVHIECPDRTIDGTGVSPVVYLPPVTAERTYRVQLLFNDDVNDGWNTFAAGSDFTSTVTLQATAG